MRQLRRLEKLLSEPVRSFKGLRESARARQRESACACACVLKKLLRERVAKGVCEREREKRARERGCECVCERDREAADFHLERWGAGVEYHFQEFNEHYAPS